MNQFSRLLKQDLNQLSESGKATTGPILGFPTHASCEDKPDTAIQLGSCVPFERIAVKTRSNMYEVIVLCGRTGEVLIRGGRYFPEFRRALLIGSTAGGSALMLRTIDVGLRMEVRDGVTLYRTTPVEAISREEFTSPGVAAQVP